MNKLLGILLCGLIAGIATVFSAVGGYYFRIQPESRNHCEDGKSESACYHIDD